MNETKLQRWLAVGLLVLLLCTVWFAGVLPLTRAAAAYRDERDDLLFRLQRQQAIAGRKVQVAEALDAMKRDFSSQRYFATSTTEALASAELQNIVKTAVANAGGQLTSTQGLPGQAFDGFFRIAVKVRMTGSLESVLSVIQNVESAIPLLVVEQLDINPIRGMRNRTTQKIEPSDQLNVSFQLAGFMRGKHDE